MGKRELVLISLFVVVGIVVYQFTAPPPPAGSEGFSVGGLVQKLKREVQGSRAVATAKSSKTLPVDASVRLVRINLPRNESVTITGSDRADIAVEMQIIARGFDEAEAKAAADGSQLKLDLAGDAAVIGHVFPSRNRGQGGFVSEATFSIALPRRLMVRLEPHIGRLTITDVAGAEIMGQRGDTRIAKVAGHVTLSHTAGRLEIESVPSLKLTSRNSNARVRGVAGTFGLDSTGGELELEEIAGPLEIEARNTELTLDAAKLVKPPFRYNGTGGELRVTNHRIESRIDGRNTEIEVTMAAAVPLTVYNSGRDITVVAPAGGYALDAVATEGRITSDDSNITATPGEGSEARAAANIRGGGPPLTLRITRGEIRVRRAAGNQPK